MPNTIERFVCEFSFMSNFHPCPVPFAGLVWPSAENAYQASKFGSEHHWLFSDASPGNAKKLSRLHSDLIAPGWGERRVSVMRQVVRAKFLNNFDLGAKLLDTGDSILVEGNHWHDNFFGVCSCGGDECLHTTGTRNRLGRILEDVRSELLAVKFRLPSFTVRVDDGESCEDADAFASSLDSEFISGVMVGGNSWVLELYPLKNERTT